MDESQSRVNSFRKSMIKKYKEWNKNTSICTKSLVFICFFGALLSVLPFAGSGVKYYFFNTPSLTVTKFQLYRILFSWLGPPSLIGGILQVFSIYPVAQKIEEKKGTVFLAVNIFVMNTITQILFVGSCYILGLLYRPIFFQTSIGMWTVFFNLLPIILKDPFQQRRVPVLFVKVPPEIYPFLMCVFFQIFGFQIDIFFAAFVGHLAVNRYRWLDLKKEKLQSFEKTEILIKIRTLTNGFVVADSAEYNDIPNFIPFSGNSNKVGKEDTSIKGGILENYIPHNNRPADEQSNKSQDSKNEELSKSTENESEINEDVSANDDSESSSGGKENTNR